MKYKKMNKKGIGPLVIPIIIGIALLFFGLGGGIITAYKINNTIQSIPTIVWIGLIILLILLMFPKKK